MKVGFSTLTCPGWDVETVVENAVSMGFSGVEIRGIRGELDLTLVPELAGNPKRARRLFKDNNVELVCLGSSATLDAKSPHTLSKQRAALIELIELAGRLSCGFVRILAGEVQGRDNHDAALARVSETLAGLVPVASQHGVTILVENGGDFGSSRDLWYLVDAVDHPLVRCCWNQCRARTAGERPTNSIPRLARRIGLVHVCDAEFDELGVLLKYVPLGEGDAEIATQIRLLQGIAYNGFVIFEWPKLWNTSLPSPQDVLPDVASFLKGLIEEKEPVLTAYKGDKHAPRLAARADGPDRA